MASTHHYDAFFVGHQNKIIHRSSNIINRSTPAPTQLDRERLSEENCTSLGMLRLVCPATQNNNGAYSMKNELASL